MHDTSVASRPSGFIRSAARARWAVSLILLVAVTTAFFDRINISVLFTNPSFHAAIGVGNDPAAMGLLMSGFVFAYGASALLISICGDIFGPRKTLSAIAALCAGLMAFMGASSSYGAMLAARVALGAAEGPQFGAANAAVKRWFPANGRALGNAMWTIGSPLGSAIGFPLVIALVAHYGWRASFYVLAGLNAVVVLPLLWWFLRDNPPPEAAPLKDDSTLQLGFAESFGVLARDRRFWLIVLFDCGAVIYLWGFNTWLPAYLQQARHFDLAHMGFYSSLPFVLMLLGEIGGAWLGDRLGRYAAIVMSSLILTGLSIYLAAIAPGAVQAAWCLAMSAFFWGASTPTLFALSLRVIPTKVTAAGFGIYVGIANLVASAAPYIMGVLIGPGGHYEAGLDFLVLACIIPSLMLIPLLRHY